MLKNVFKHKKKDKDKNKKKNKIQKSSSMEEYNDVKSVKKLKDQSHSSKSKHKKRSQTNPYESEHPRSSRSKKRKKKLNPSSSTHQLYNRNKPFKCNDYVLLTNKRKGIIRYIGHVHFGTGSWYGIELMDGTIGNHDGKVGNKRYFKTPSKRAIFVTYDQIKKRINDIVIHIKSDSKSKKKKKKKNKNKSNSNSLKKTAKNRHNISTVKKPPNRPNSAKKFDEVFFNGDIIIPFQPKQVPPPPPLPVKTHSKSNRNSYSSHSQSRSHRSKEDIMPLDIPTYSLQPTNETNISTELSAINDEMDSVSPLDMRNMNKTKLIMHKSYNSAPVKHMKVNNVSMRKNKSYAEGIKGDNDRLRFHDFYKNCNLNEHEVLKLKNLQNSLRRTQNKSEDLEQLLSATPPSLPATPNDINLLFNSKNDSKFSFGRQRSKSTDSLTVPTISNKKNKKKVSNQELISEAEDTDIEDMYNECDGQMETMETKGQLPTINGLEQAISEEKEIDINNTRPRSYKNNTVIIHDEIFPDITTPRAVGTDALQRIRSRSIQSIKEKKGNGINRKESIKTARDICPFWNPFNIGGGECPYLSVDSVSCELLHLSKEEYLNRMCEDDLIDLLTKLFCDSLFVESCLVIEKLLLINPMNDEYNTCFGDILEELGRYSEAEKYYVNALSINPYYDDAHNNYAMMLHHKLNRFSEAEIQYKKCLNINNLHQVCYTNYAKLLQYLNRYRECEIYFKKCLSLNEENINCHNYYGIFLYEMGRWSESKYHLKKAIELNKKVNKNKPFPSYNYNYAKLLCDLKEYNLANEQFKLCLKYEPTNAIFNFEYGLFLAFDLQNIKLSVKYFVNAYILDPLNKQIEQKYNEITNIIIKNGGLKKIKRRKSSASNIINNNGMMTVIEYQQENEMKSEYSNPCQAEFHRFLLNNFSFGNCMNIYLKKFESCELNDIRYINSIDYDTLIKDIQMKKVHSKIFMNKINIFKNENMKFINWLTDIQLQEYYQIFEKNAICTFESFYKHIHTKYDLIKIIGQNNAMDSQLIWEKCPKVMRQNNSLSMSLSKNNSLSVEDGFIDTGQNYNHDQEGKQT